jgi:hypothetical protein
VCHAWGASPNIEIFRTLVGVTPGAPGYATVRIEPNPGSLTSFQAVVPHPKGLIQVEFRKDRKTRVHVQLPPAVSGIFVWKGQSYALRAGENQLTL